MKIYKLLLYMLVNLMLITSLSGCKAKTSVLFQDTTCKYPCWQSIRPGSSSSQEAIQFLSESPFVDSPPTIVPQNIVGAYSYTGLKFKTGYFEDGGWIAFYNDKVVYIEFDINNHIKISDLIAYYGKPKFSSIISGEADTRWLQVSWIYPDQGVILIHYEPSWKSNGGQVNVTPDLPVYEVYYFNPDSFDSLADSRIFQMVNKEIVLKSIQPWVNFGPESYTDSEEP